MRLCDADAIPEGSARVFECGDHLIAVFHIAGAHHAISDICPHQHIPALAGGLCEGHVVTCPMHGWRFDVRTGRNVDTSGRVRTYPVWIEDGGLHVELPPPREEDW